VQNLSRHHIKYVLGIDIPLNEQISISKEQAFLIIEAQLLYENFLDSIKKFAGDIKSGIVKGFNDFKDFASTLYRVISDGISEQFSNSLLRTFVKSDIKKTIDAILEKVGKKDLLVNLLTKIKNIQNPVGKLISIIGFTTVAKFFYDKFKDLDLSSENIKNQISSYLKDYLSDAAIEALEGFLTGGFSQLKSWLERIGIGAKTIYNTLSTTINSYKDAFDKQDAGDKFAVKLVREDMKTKLPIDQLMKGVEAEMEHTKKIKDKKEAELFALKIALDHLGEDPKYYDKLKKAGLEELNEGEFCPQCLAQYIRDHVNVLHEAEYKGRKVQLGKPMAGDVKKFKVYVKNAKGNVVKVNFGQKGVKIKKNNPERRKSFRARHHCDTNPGPRWKARYWSCRKW